MKKTTTVGLDRALVDSARIHAESTRKQIEYWAMLGRLAEQNPDLPHDFLVGLLQARAQVKVGDVSEYSWG